MKADFTDNDFSANDDKEKSDAVHEKASIAQNSPKAIIPILGCVSLFCSLSLIPFGFLASTGVEICYNLLKFSYVNFISAYIVSLIMIVLFSSAIAVLSIVLYCKSNRNKFAISGLVISITALISVFLGTAYNVFVLIVHFI